MVNLVYPVHIYTLHTCVQSLALASNSGLVIILDSKSDSRYPGVPLGFKSNDVSFRKISKLTANATKK